MQCVNIHTLNLRHNLLTGPVPSEIAHLTKLAALDLSLNKQLTGPDNADIFYLFFMNFMHTYSFVWTPPPSTQFLIFLFVVGFEFAVPDGVPLATDYDDLYYDNPTSCTAFTTAMRDKYPALQ